MEDEEDRANQTKPLVETLHDDHFVYNESSDENSSIREEGVAALALSSMPTDDNGNNDVKMNTRNHRLRVVAPATLPAGFQFNAQLEGNGEIFKVTVPTGGVREGEEMTIFHSHPELIGSSCPEIQIAGKYAPPTGDWKDGLLGCCNHGPLHPVFCCPLLCVQIATAQVMQRMKLTWLARSDQPEKIYNRTTRTVVYLVFFVFAIDLIMSNLFHHLGDDDTSSSSTLLKSIQIVDAFFGLMFFGYTIFIVTKARFYMRRVFDIPEKRCHGCEDFCVSFWCTCCTVSQMTRHTADYSSDNGDYCSSTGLAQGDVEVVWDRSKLVDDSFIASEIV